MNTRFDMSMLRKWATPLTIGSFIVMGVTGVLMFFHLDSGLNKLIHEWASWVMLAGVGAHLIQNWRAFTTYFKRPVALGIIAVGVLALGVSFAPVQGGGSPVKLVMQSLGEARIETVIELAGLDVETGLTVLSEAGLEAGPGQTLGEMTGGNRGREMAALEALFGE